MLSRGAVESRHRSNLHQASPITWCIHSETVRVTPDPLDNDFNKGMMMETRGRRPVHDFSTHEIGKAKLYTKAKNINGKPINLISLVVCARNYGNKHGLKVEKKEVTNGIKLTFTKRGT